MGDITTHLSYRQRLFLFEAVGAASDSEEEGLEEPNPPNLPDAGPDGDDELLVCTGIDCAPRRGGRMGSRINKRHSKKGTEFRGRKLGQEDDKVDERLKRTQKRQLIHKGNGKVSKVKKRRG